MKRLIACALMLAIMLTITPGALAEECRHDDVEHMKYYRTIRDVEGGHEYQTYEKAYCNDCDSVVLILVSSFLEGHSFVVYKRNHYDTPSGDYDETIYRCTVCGFETIRSNPCDGSCFPIYQ